MDLFNERINEYVNWVDGKHYFTGRNVTDNMKPSGKVIRELLQERLRTPIFIPSTANVGTSYVDDGYWRIFSSKDAYDLWASDKQLYASLELAKFPKQSEYEFEITGLENNTRFIIEGNSSSNQSILAYTWKIKKGNNNINDSVRVTYSIHNKTTGRTESFSELYLNDKRDIVINLYDYLDRGENNITINFEGIGTKAAGGSYVVINMIQFDMEAEWNYTAQHPQGQPLIINNFRVNRNNSDADVNVHIYIDGINEVGLYEFYKGDSNIQKSNITIPYDEMIMTPSSNGNPITHNLQIWATTSYQGTQFTSNILYYNFEIQASESLSNVFINLNASLNSDGLANIPVQTPKFSGKQYISSQIKYGYNTDSQSLNSSIQIKWRLIKESSQDIQELGTFTVNKWEENILEFNPSLATEGNKHLYLIAIHDDEEVLRVPIEVEKGQGFKEQTGYVLKLSAFGKVNDSAINPEWTYGSGNNKITTSFSNGVSWDDNKGWYKNSFRVHGLDAYATVNYSPLLDISTGKTIEIDFESEKVNSNNDIIILIGNTRGARIEITPNRASMYNSSNNLIIETNFKSNERLHLAFIINKATDNTGANKANLVYIVNNGILERAVGISGSLTTDGTIKFGGSRSGVRVFSLRVYDYDITYKNAYDNYEFDSDDKIAIKQKNSVIDEATNTISYEACCSKIDTILIEGNLTNLLDLNTGKDESTTDVTISRICPFDKSLDFTCYNAQIRKHGQSTLNYPVPSMKFWFNKSKSGVTPRFVCTAQEGFGFNKNRYIMRNPEYESDGVTIKTPGSIPSNKFVLQANYSDSSGCHNGALQKIINYTWWNAKIDGEYKLRTLPQLFTSNQTVSATDANLYTNLDPNKESTTGKNEQGKQWKDYTNKDFPYQIQVGPDSFPCVVFYKDTSQGGKETFLGLYVFMEDKKADYIYGERSIYYYKDKDNKFDLSDDPFVLKYINTKNGEHAIELPNGNKQALDSDDNRIWDNENVLRIEGLTINTTFSSFMSFKDASNKRFDDIVSIYDENGKLLKKQYRWEQDFEMIYPDPDDIEGKVDELTGRDTTKFGLDSKFKRTAQPWVDFFEWVTDTYKNQERFEHEAAQHFDIYKMAAYYIIFLRFGLVDSVERNAQWKTYDGKHWHCEPWDMDIALGNMNTGGIAFDPPIDRNSTFKTDSGTYAYSGRSLTTSNWIWDAFEAWPYWMNTLVPLVADAMAQQKLTYKEIIKYFDDDYQNKWCEILYNESMNYKYILSRGNDNGWLGWLQGARTTHRHWWLSTSMNTYDAIWNCGDYKSHFIKIYANKDQNIGGAKEYFTVGTNSEIYVNVDYQGSPIAGSPQKISPISPYKFDITSQALSNKVEFMVYGASFIEIIDCSAFASGIVNIQFNGAYDDVLGAPLKNVNLGCPYTDNGYDLIEGSYNGVLKNISIDNAFDNIETLNINGQISSILSNLFETLIYTGNKTSLKNFYARGSSLTSFYSSMSGNDFDVIELPGHTYDPTTIGGIDYNFGILKLYNSTWNRLIWYDGVITPADSTSYNAETGELEAASSGTISYKMTNIDGDASYNIPWTLNTVEFHGSTAKTDNSKKFVLNWIRCIERYIEYHVQLGDIEPGRPGTKYENCETIEDMLYLELGERTLILDGVKWDQYDSIVSPNGTCEDCVTFRDLELISKFNHGNNNPDNNANGQSTYKGYIEVSSYEPELSVEELSQLKNWFGETIFSLKSSGLIIDQKLKYVKINVGGKAYTEPNPVTGALEINLDENNDELNAATLSATKFQLQEDDSEITWGMKTPGSTEPATTVYRGCTIKKGADGIVRLIASETTYGNRDVEVVCSMMGEEPSYVTIHIKAVKYPDSITLAVDDTINGNRSKLRQFKGAYVFWQNAIFAEFYPDIVWDNTSENAAQIKSITYKIVDTSTNAQLLNIQSDGLRKGDNTEFPIDGTDYLRYTKNANALRNGIVLTCTVPTGQEYYEYMLQVQIIYKSNAIVNLETKLIVINDPSQIVTTAAGSLYSALSDHYEICNGEGINNKPFYRTDLLSLNGTISFARYTDITDILIVPDNASIPIVSIFRYMPNIEGINLSGCTNINTVKLINNNYVTELDTSACPNLKILNMQGCTNFGYNLESTNVKHKQVDLSRNFNIESVDLRGTYVDVVLPNIVNSNDAKLTSLKLGTPNTVTLNKQDALYSNNVSVENPNELTSISLTSESVTKTDLFKTFASIIQNINIE